VRPRTNQIVTGVAVGLMTALSVTACGNAGNDSAKPSIVASTSVWGDIAATVAGPDASVESLITDPAQDPHSHETSALESATISDADLVVYNGGHYDEFVGKALAGSEARTVEAFSHRADDIRDQSNEHVWYDTETVAQVAERVSTTLGELDPEHAAAYTERATALQERLTDIAGKTADIAAEHPQTPVLQTEPLAYYLLADAGADDRTPAEYQEAIEQETDPAAAAIAETRDLAASRKVDLLLYNVQTADPVSRDLRAAAEAANIPVVEMAETLPPETSYVDWQTANVRALAEALN